MNLIDKILLESEDLFKPRNLNNRKMLGLPEHVRTFPELYQNLYYAYYWRTEKGTSFLRSKGFYFKGDIKDLKNKLKNEDKYYHSIKIVRFITDLKLINRVLNSGRTANQLTPIGVIKNIEYNFFTTGFDNQQNLSFLEEPLKIFVDFLQSTNAVLIEINGFRKWNLISNSIEQIKTILANIK